jgi:hypothetical protein
MSATETSLTFTGVNERCYLWAAVNVGIRNTEERTMKNHLLGEGGGGLEKWLFLYFDGDLDIGVEIGVKFN